MDDITKKRVGAELDYVGEAVKHVMTAGADTPPSFALPAHFHAMGLAPGRFGDMVSTLPITMALAMRAGFAKDGMIAKIRDLDAKGALRHSGPYVAFVEGGRPNADITSKDRSGELYLAIGRFYRNLKASLIELDITIRHDDPSLPFEDRVCSRAVEIYAEMIVMMWDPLAPCVAALVGDNPCPDCGEPTKPS